MYKVSESTNQQVSNPILTNDVINVAVEELQNIQLGLLLNDKRGKTESSSWDGTETK